MCVHGRSFRSLSDPSLYIVMLFLDSEPSLPVLMNKIAAVIPSKYETVGIQLGLTLAELQAIRPQHPSLKDHLRAFGEMFDMWRRRGSPPYTWRTLISVLKAASVGEVSLSDSLVRCISCDGPGDEVANNVQ